MSTGFKKNRTTSAAKKAARKKHTCYEQANKLLAADNTKLSMDISFNMATNTMTMEPKFATEKLDPRIRSGRPKTVTFSYCPICGRKL